MAVDYMIRVGADFSGVLSQLKALDQQIATTQAKAATAGTTVARVPSAVQQIASGQTMRNQNVDFRDVARQQAMAAGLIRQVAEVNARKLGATPDQIVSTRHGRGSELDTARKHLADQLGITQAQIKDFNRAWDAQISQMFGGRYQSVLQASPNQVLSQFSRYANQGPTKTGPGGPLAQLGVSEKVLVSQLTEKEVAEMQRSLSATQASNNVIQSAQNREAKAAQQVATEREKLLALLRRGVITAAEANRRMLNVGATTPAQMVPYITKPIAAPSSTIPPRLDFSQVDPEFLSGGQARVFREEQLAAIAREVAEQHSLMVQETAAKRSRLAAETRLTTELNEQIAVSEALTKLMVAEATSKANRQTVLTQGKLSDSQHIAEERARRQAMDAYRAATDPNAPRKEHQATQRVLQQQANARASRQKQMDDMWSKREEAANTERQRAEDRAAREVQQDRERLDAEERSAQRELARERRARARSRERAEAQAENERLRQNTRVDRAQQRTVYGPHLPPEVERTRRVLARRELNVAALDQMADPAMAERLAALRLAELQAQQRVTQSESAQVAISEQINALEAQILASKKLELARVQQMASQLPDMREAARLQGQAQARQAADRAVGRHDYRLENDPLYREALSRLQANQIGPRSSTREGGVRNALNTGQQLRTQTTTQVNYAYEREILAIQQAHVRAELKKLQPAEREAQLQEQLAALKAESVQLRQAEKAATRRAASAAEREANARIVTEDGSVVANRAYQQRGIDAARQQLAESRIQEEAARRNAQRIVPQAYSDTFTDFANEKRILAVQMQQLKAAQAKLQGMARNAATEQETANVNAQILALEQQQRLLTNAHNDAIRRGIVVAGGAGGGTVPPNRNYGPTAGGPTGGGPTGGGSFYDRTRHAGGVGGFFAGGALSTIRYGLPSMALYGGFRGITNMIKEAEELEYNLARLEGQFDSLFGGRYDFGPVRGEILALAKETGLAADDIADFQIQVTGAFASENIAGLQGIDLINAQVESAAKLAQTVHLPLSEITDGLTAASLAFEASFQEIGDIALALEQESGVLARETISFIGDIAPVAREAGFEIEEFSAIAAVAQQRSGRTGAALAESFGRVIPALTEQKEQLLELATIEDSLATPAFIDAVRSSDVRAIFEGIGAAYRDMSTEAKQLTVQLLGGRREAQAIIPALTNRDIIDRYIDVGKGAEGTLDERFAKIQETLTNAASRLSEAVRQFGVEILEAGLSDFFELAIDGAKGILAVLSPIMSAVGTINDLFGGWPSKILLTLGAFKALRAIMTVDGQIIGSQFLANMLYGGSRGASATGAAPGGLAGIIAGFQARRQIMRDQYRTLRQPVLDFSSGRYPYYTAPGSIPVRAEGPPTPYVGGPANSRLRAGAGAFRAGTAGLGGAFGGIAAFGGITALTMLYSEVNNRIAEDRDALRELNRTIEEENLELDLSDVNIRDRRIQDLVEQSRQARRRMSDITKLWRDIANIQTESESLLAEAVALNVDPGVEDFFDRTDGLIDKELSRRVTPRLGRPTAGFRRAIELKKEQVNKTLTDRIVDAINPFDTDVGDALSDRGLREDEQKFVDEIAKLGDLEGEVRPEIIEAFLDPGEDVVGLLNQMAAREGPYEELHPLVVKQANALRAAIARLGENDPKIKEMMDELDELDSLSEQYNDTIKDLEGLKIAKDVGLISLESYINRAAEILERRRDIIIELGEGEASEADFLKVLQEERAVWSEYASSITAQQDTLRRIAEAYGATDRELADAGALINIRNLNDPFFKDQDARLEQAIQLLEYEKNLALEMAYASENQDEIDRLLREGVEVPAKVREVFYTSQLFATEEWKQLAGSMEEVMKDPFFDPSSRYGGAIGKIGTTPEEIAQSVLGEFFEFGELSEETRKKMLAEITRLMSAANREGLTDDQKAAVHATLDGFVDLFMWVGGTQEEIVKQLVAGIRAATGNSPFIGMIANTFLDDFIKNSPFLAPPPETAQVDQERTFEVERARFSRRQAEAWNDSVAIAAIQQEAARAELEFAEGMEPGIERRVAIEKAKEAIARADQSMVDALRGISQARASFYATMAELNGDFVGAANAEIDAARSDYAYAKQTGDAEGQWAAKEREARAIRRREQEALADRQSGRELDRARREIVGDRIGAALIGVEIAEDARRNARGTREINDATREVERAREEVRRAFLEERAAIMEHEAAKAAYDGDFVRAAEIRERAAEERRRAARSPQERRDAEDDKRRAEEERRQAQADLRASRYGVRIARVARDPLASARLELELANKELAEAKGEKAKNEIRARIIDIERRIEDAMNDARYARYELRQAELEAMDDSAGAAAVAAEMARRQLSDAIAAGAGRAEIDRMRAEVIRADKAAADAAFQEQLDDYQWMLDMGQITQGQFITWLEGIKSRLIPGTKKFKDIELMIKRLKDGISNDLQMNMPSQIDLPTLYEVRRFIGNNNRESAAGSVGGIGYQDNRQQQITFNISGVNASEIANEVLAVTENIFAPGRSGNGPRRF